MEKYFCISYTSGLSSDNSSPIVSTSVGQWLSSLGFSDYESLFINYGFDDLEFIVSIRLHFSLIYCDRRHCGKPFNCARLQNGVLDESDLCDMGINSDQERAMIMDAVGLLNKRVEKRSGHGQSVDEWLKSIHMENYTETFRKHLYTDMDRVKRIWEVELAAVLEIQKPAHRKRILASVSGPNSARAQTRNGTGANLEDLNKDLNTLVSDRLIYYLIVLWCSSFLLWMIFKRLFKIFCASLTWFMQLVHI